MDKRCWITVYVVYGYSSHKVKEFIRDLYKSSSYKISQHGRGWISSDSLIVSYIDFFQYKSSNLYKLQSPKTGASLVSCCMAHSDSGVSKIKVLTRLKPTWKNACSRFTNLYTFHILTLKYAASYHSKMCQNSPYPPRFNLSPFSPSHFSILSASVLTLGFPLTEK